MDRSLILYLHGFCSSPASWKSRLLQAEMAARGLSADFLCPQLPASPALAMQQMSRLIESLAQPLTLVGSSLGGHYANHLAEKYGLRAVLVNPAVVACLDASRFVGEHQHFHSGERFDFTVADAGDLAAQLAPPTPSRYWVLLETGDEVLDWRQARDFYADCRQTVLAGGDHSFTRFPDFVPQILEYAGI